MSMIPALPFGKLNGRGHIERNNHVVTDHQCKVLFLWKPVASKERVDLSAAYSSRTVASHTASNLRNITSHQRPKLLNLKPNGLVSASHSLRKMTYGNCAPLLRCLPDVVRKLKA